ncbi:DUF4258 domain-containing protein [Candidatus Parcubacteria bacterium]|nr:MAG: DUF4258 domain-containing protein [Candidatus Parcubacteria bacterium]
MFWDYLLDGAGIAYDIYVIRTEGASFGNVATFALDVVLAAAPFIPSIGGLKALGKTASHGDEVVKGAEGIAKGGALVVRNPLSVHAAKRLAERGISRKMVRKAIEQGTHYYDRLHGTIAHVL